VTDQESMKFNGSTKGHEKTLIIHWLTSCPSWAL
jgi:hypothetical protein